MNVTETLAQEFNRLVEEYRSAPVGSNGAEAWNLIADFAVDNSTTISAALEAVMAQAPTPTPATWQRRQKYALRFPTVDADPWKECGYKEATDMFEPQPGYEYRPLYAAPPPASEAVKVKLLEWKQTDMPPYVSYVATIIGTYRIEHVPLGDKWVAHLNGFGQLSQVSNTEEEAKVVSQADYERRILSALSRTTEEG